MKPRYAVYFAPPRSSPLALFGARAIGVDAESGRDVPPSAAISAALPDWRDLVAAPSRYGFHATLKAPFELAPGRSEADLISGVEKLAARLTVVEIGQLEVSTVSRFVALIPQKATSQLAEFAAHIVEELDALRAPLTLSDRDRRRPENLTERQRALLDRWGYPFVLEEFRLHMTLTGVVQYDRIEAVRRVMDAAFRSEVPTWNNPVRIDCLSVFFQPERDARFRVLSRHPLVG